MRLSELDILTKNELALLVNSKPLDIEFGRNGKDWNWEKGGTVKVSERTVTIALRDLTGFDGRCDAIYLTTEDNAPPETVDKTAKAWRKKLLGLPDEPVGRGVVVHVGHDDPAGRVFRGGNVQRDHPRVLLIALCPGDRRDSQGQGDHDRQSVFHGMPAPASF